MIRDESSGSLLGRSLGSGLGEGLAALIEWVPRKRRNTF
jgi:hypothetical protein